MTTGNVASRAPRLIGTGMLFSAIGVATVLLTPSPALADRHEHWRHEHWRHAHDGVAVYGSPAYGYAAPAYGYASPPVVYAPPPPPAGLNFMFNIR